MAQRVARRTRPSQPTRRRSDKVTLNFFKGTEVGGLVDTNFQ